MVTSIQAVKGFKQGLYLEYVGATDLRVSAGKVYVEDASENGVLLDLATQATPTLPTLDPETWYYVYASPPTSGRIPDFSIGKDAPKLSESRRGYYREAGSPPALTDERCIGAFRTSAGSPVTITPFYQEAHWVSLTDSVIVVEENVRPSNTFQATPAFDIPDFVRVVNVWTHLSHIADDVQARRLDWRTTGLSGTGVSNVTMFGRAPTTPSDAGAEPNVSMVANVVVNNDLKIDRKVSGASVPIGSDLTLDIRIQGWGLPLWMGDTPAAWACVVE